MFDIIPKDDAAQALRVKRFLMAFASYSVWCFIALFSFLLGMTPVSWYILLICYLGILVSNGLIYYTIRSGYNKQFKDPSLTLVQMVVATFWTMVIIYFSDAARSGVLMLYLVVFVFGLFKLNLREFLYLSLYAVFNYAVVIFLLYNNRPESISSRVDILNLIILALVLPWFSFMGGYITRLKGKLSRSLTVAKETELKFKTIFDSASDGITMLDFATGKFAAANDKACRMLGYTLDEFLKLKVSDLHPREYLKLILSQYEKVNRQEIAIARNIPLIKKDKTMFYADISGSRITMGGREYSVGVIRDITERRQSEKLLEESEKRYRLLANNVTDLIFTMDMHFAFSYVSPSAYRVLGYQAEDLKTMKLENLVDPDTFGRFKDILKKEMETEKRVDKDLKRSRVLEFQMTRKNGLKIWLETTVSFLRDDNGRAIGIIGTAHDISDRKRSQEILRQSEEKYRTILEHMEEGYFEVDLAGNYTFCNDALCRIHGYSKDELMGINNRQYTEEDVVKKVYRAFNTVYKTGQSNRAFAWQIIRKDGEKRYIESSISLLKDSSNNPVGFSGVIRDITERREMEKKLRFEEKRFRYFVEHSSDIIVLMNLEGNITYINPSVKNILGYSQEERIGSKGFELVHPDDLNALAEAFLPLFVDPNASAVHVEFRLLHKNGTYLTVEAVGSNLVRDNVIEAVICNYRDITERNLARSALEKSEQRYLTLSIIDDLTQLYNSRHFYAQLDKEMERSVRYEQPLTLLLLDLDKFKDFNDTYGHVEGDAVLARLGQVIKRCLRDPDSGYRYGGEEFTIILPMTRSEDGTVTARRIHSEFSREVFMPLPGQKVSMTMSIGVAQYQPAEDMKAFVHRVDQLMYQAKNAGRNRICSE